MEENNIFGIGSVINLQIVVDIMPTDRTYWIGFGKDLHTYLTQTEMSAGQKDEAFKTVLTYHTQFVLPFFLQFFQ